MQICYVTEKAIKEKVSSDKIKLIGYSTYPKMTKGKK